MFVRSNRRVKIEKQVDRSATESEKGRERRERRPVLIATLYLDLVLGEGNRLG